MEALTAIEMIQSIQDAADKQTSVTDVFISLMQKLISASESGSDIDVRLINKINEFAVTSQKFSKELVEFTGKLINS